MQTTHSDFTPDPQTGSIISSAIEVHKRLGKGFNAGLYKIALCKELLDRGFDCELNAVRPVHYKGACIGEHTVDLIVDEGYLLMIRANATDAADLQAELRSELKITRLDTGLVLNFGHRRMLDGVKRVYLPLSKAEG